MNKIKTDVFTIVLLVFCAVVVAGCFERGVRPPPAALPAAPVHFDAALTEWRCAADNVGVNAVKEYCGRKHVLNVKYPLDAAKKGGQLDFAGVDLRPMLGSWLPPYVGNRTRKISFSIRPVVCDAKSRFHFRYRLNPSWYAKNWTVKESKALGPDLKSGAWNDFVFDVAPGEYERLADLSFVFAGAGGCEFAVADLKLTLDDDSEYVVLNDDPPRYTTGMKEPFAAKPVKPFPRRPRIQFGVGGYWCMESGDDAAAFGEYMKKYLPEYDIVISLGSPFDPRTTPSMAKAPENVYWQYQGGQHDLRYAKLKDALVKMRDGRSQSRMFNSSVATHPLLRDSFEEQIAYAGSLGFNNIQRFDYVWYYPEGPSGFDDASAVAFREDLTESDEGLLLVAYGKYPERRIRFWEYYADYYGKRLVPADMGLGSWNAYKPKFGTPREQSLHWALVAYEWLRLAQRFGEWSHKYCYGTPYDYLLNGEFHGNGNDHVYLPRLKVTGISSPEFFSGTLKELCGVYHGAGRFLRNARGCGKRLGVTLETSRGGSGSQPYWSAKTGYAVCYLLSALGFDAFEYDGLPGPYPWEDYLSGKKSIDKIERDLGMADARGYRQAKIDGAAKRASNGVYHLIERPVLGVTKKSFYLDARTPDEFPDFRYQLQAAELVYETTDPQELPDVIDDAKVIFVSPTIKREDTRALLEKWNSAKPGRVLVTDKARAAETIAALKLAVVQKPVSAGGTGKAEVASFDCTVGSAAILFNRKACADADRAEWYEKTWRPVVYKRTYKPEDLLYFDKCLGAHVSAEVPVAKDGVYRVYRAISGKDERVNAKDGWLKLVLGDDLTDVFYYGEDTDAFRSFIAKVKADRSLTADFWK